MILMGNYIGCPSARYPDAVRTVGRHPGLSIRVSDRPQGVRSPAGRTPFKLGGCPRCPFCSAPLPDGHLIIS
jgi:hypothetical protein